MSGATDFGSRLMLATLFPGGADVHVALFTTIPDFEGGAGIEVSAGWYARVAHQDWLFESGPAGFVARVNSGSIAFPNVAGDSVTIVAWGIFDAASAGNLLWFGPTKTPKPGLVEQPFTVAVGDNPQFIDGELILPITPTTDTTLPTTLTTEDTLQTTDATPTNFDNPIHTLTDEQGVKVVTEVRSKSTTNHYSRRIVKKYTRDDAGPGTTIWNVDEVQTDGPATRVGFGAGVTADLILSGANIELQVTGQAATTVDWTHTTTVIVDDA